MQRLYPNNNGYSQSANGVAFYQNNEPVWVSKVSKHDLDGDGVENSVDRCKDSALNSTVAENGCGLFDAVLSDVTFKPGSDWLSPRARGSLDKVAITMLAFPEARAQVRAHTDSNGPADENLGLSARRAESVVAYLTGKGISEMQLETLGLGESQPLDTNETKEGRKRNRRVELLTLTNIDKQTMMEQAPRLAAANASPAPAMQPTGKNAIATPLKPQFGEPVFPSMSGVKIEPLPRSEIVPGLSLGGVLSDVEFIDNSATLTDDSNKHLRVVSQKLAKFPDVRLVVMGHTDNQLSPKDSKALSEQRANAIVNFLISEGIDASRLSAEGFGSSLPVAQNVTEDDRRRNRRVELRVIN